MRIASGLIALCTLAGCNRVVSFSYYDDDPPRYREVHVHRGHVCTEACDHYWAGDGFVVIHRHHHGPGCGHVLRNGRWIVVHHDEPEVHVHHSPRHEPAERVHRGPHRIVEVEHVHGPNCGCVYDRAGSKWVKVGKKHVHGPGCGHRRVDGRWVISRH